MIKFAYRSKDGDIRFGHAGSLEALEKKHWVRAGTAKTIDRLPSEGDTYNYEANTISKKPMSPKERARRTIMALIPKLKEGTASMAQVQKVLAHLLGD